MNEWKKKCVGLQRTWVSKRTVDTNPPSPHASIVLMSVTSALPTIFIIIRIYDPSITRWPIGNAVRCPISILMLAHQVYWQWSNCDVFCRCLTISSALPRAFSLYSSLHAYFLPHPQSWNHTRVLLYCSSSFPQNGIVCSIMSAKYVQFI